MKDRIVIYEGARGTDGRARIVANGRRIDPCLWIVNHSPEGFGWGFSGSGPAQTAVAILFHHLRPLYHGVKTASRLAADFHQDFKRHVIACLPNEWQMDCRAIEEFRSMMARAADGQVIDWNLWRASAFERGVLLAVKGAPTIRG